MTVDANVEARGACPAVAHAPGARRAESGRGHGALEAQVAVQLRLADGPSKLSVPGIDAAHQPSPAALRGVVEPDLPRRARGGDRIRDDGRADRPVDRHRAEIQAAVAAQIVRRQADVADV